MNDLFMLLLFLLTLILLHKYGAQLGLVSGEETNHSSRKRYALLFRPGMTTKNRQVN
jgi:hypothetical protein